MFSTQVLKKCLIPAAAVMVESRIKSETEREKCFCRPSELPIYTPEQEHVQSIQAERVDETPGKIESAIRTTRQTLAKYSEEASAYKRVAVEQIDKSKENVEWLIDYLQEEDNTMPKAGAIGIGALTGLIFGLRGGLIKKTIYATTGALGMGAVCYPKEAAEYTQVGLQEGKKYLTIAYNFIYGDQESKTEQVNSLSDTQVKDPVGVITNSYDNANAKSCHCPIGACLGHPEKSRTSSPVSPPNDSVDQSVV